MAADPKWKERAQQTVLGTDIRRVDGPTKVTGRARYTHDVRLPGMVYARLVLHPYPRVDLRAIDVAPALEVPGVVHAEPRKPEGEGILHQGDDSVVAVVAALTPEAAEEGARAVRVEGEELWPPVVTVDQALEPDAPGVGPDGVKESPPDMAGDEERAREALDACELVVDEVYELPVQHHACLETHGVVVDYRGGDSATVYASTQAVSGAAREAAQLLSLPASGVRVLCEHMGGGFGSKFGLGLEGRVACELARSLGRPVHLMLTRSQEFLMAGNRSGSRQRMTAGASADGRFVALLVDAIREGGQSRGSLPNHPYIYRVEHAFHVARSVYTALDGARAMRAPGHPQASFAIESVVDELAYGLGIDPLEFRKTNLDDPVWHRQLERVAREVGWHEHPHRTRPGEPNGDVVTGIGFGVSVWGGRGSRGSRCEVRVTPDGAVSAAICTQDLGTGVRTMVAAIVAEELGLGVLDVQARIGDSDLPPSVGSGGSVTTGSVAPTVKHAAHNAREALAEHVAGALNVPPERLVWRDRRVFDAEDPATALDWGQAAALLGNEPLVAQGEFRPELTDGTVHGAQAARVRVDCLTGEVRVEKMVCVQDSGLVFNALAFRSQLNGGMVQALSYGLLEERVFDADLGLMLTANFEDYKIAGAVEIPEMIAIPDEEDERQAAIGMAEAPVIPGHGAIANAIHNACGVRLRRMPLTADKILMGLVSRSGR